MQTQRKNPITCKSKHINTHTYTLSVLFLFFSNLNFIYLLCSLFLYLNCILNWVLLYDEISSCWSLYSECFSIYLYVFLFFYRSIISQDGVEEVEASENVGAALFKDEDDDSEIASAVVLTSPPIEEKLARLGLSKMIVVSKSPVKKTRTTPSTVNYNTQPEVLPWWADWAVYFCGLSAHWEEGAYCLLHYS